MKSRSRKRLKESERNLVSISSSDSDTSISCREAVGPTRSPTEINPANSRFKQMFSCETYCLETCDQSESSRAKKKVRSTIQKFKTTLVTKKFDGLNPLSILPFLAKLKLEAYDQDALEGMMQLVIPTVLKGIALIFYESALQYDNVDAHSIGIKT